MKIASAIAGLSLLFLNSSSVVAIEAEPNWLQMFAEIMKDEASRFVSPSLGETITIERRVGGSLSGKVSAISSNSIAIDGKTFQASQLTPVCCDKIFSLYHSASIARQKVLEEQKDYQTRKKEEDARIAEEKRKAEIERARVEAERVKAEKEAKLMAEDRQRLEQEKADTATRLEKEQKEKKAAQLEMVGIVILWFMGFCLYMLPTLIAIKRVHRNVAALFVLNLLLGWTLLGWVGSLIWALIRSSSDKSSASIR